MMKDLTAIKFRLILMVALLLLVVGGIAVFLFGYSKVKEYAVSAQDTASQASASNSSLQTLITTKKSLEDNQPIITKAAQLVSESKSYVYQDQIISDINHFATEAGLSITNISFASTTTTGAGTTTPTTAGAPAGIKSVTATVTLAPNINYDNMLSFIHLIEQSLFRMQISKISLSQSSEEGAANGNVNSDALTIEVYVR